ncbi:MAG: hypothetical protein ABSG43_15460 [Solirubrobacteraceae bacterium]|jgi:UDP-N-acetylmuramyl pentapeptide phosphotransferase/UDP-N-acetylglucosamine-1-phosphate transferase
MNRRSRIAAFGSAGSLVLAGAVCAAVIGGGLGEILALVLIGLGFVAATSLVFLEVGISEDRERAREQARLRARSQRPSRRGRRDRPQLDRMRGRPRRLG